MNERVTDEELTVLALKAQSRLIDVEKENAALRQLVKDLYKWIQCVSTLTSAAQKEMWELVGEELQQNIRDLMGEQA